MPGIPYGSKGPGVTTLQQKLNVLLGPVVNVDGDYGANTEEAVQQAYAQLNVVPASGVASDALLNALDRSTSKPPSDSSLNIGKIAAVVLGVLGLGWFLSNKK